MKKERIYLSENKFSLEHFVTGLWTNKLTFSYVVYYESFKKWQRYTFHALKVGKQGI